MKKINILLVFVLIVSLFTGVTYSKAASTVKVHYINVGQGDSILIQTGNENVLIDGGGKGKGDEVVAYLKKQKVKTLNAVVSTHPDADHIGGLAYVIQSLNVKKHRYTLFCSMLGDASISGGIGLKNVFVLLG